METRELEPCRRRAIYQRLAKLSENPKIDIEKARDSLKEFVKNPYRDDYICPRCKQVFHNIEEKDEHELTHVIVQKTTKKRGRK